MIRKICAVLLIGLVALVGSSCGGDNESTTPTAELAALPCGARLQSVLAQALLDSQGPYELGISAAVIVPGSAPWAGVSGVSHPGVPVSGDMAFNVGSIAKSFEAAVALMLAEEGLLDLDEPISTWLPALDHVDRMITVRQLLNHTSGVFNVFEHPDFPWVAPGVDYERRWRLEEVIAYFVDEPYGPPGIVQHYSSTNYLLLTNILEMILETPVPEEVERRFLEPLGLEHTYMSMGALPPATFSVAYPWVDVDLDGELEELSGVPQTWIASLTHPVLYAAPADIARWMDALYQKREVLPAASLDEMLTFPQTNQVDPEGGRYGLGVVDFSEILGVNVIGHGGSALGYSAAALYLPDEGVSLAWAINTGESPRQLADMLMMNTWEALSGVVLNECFP
jgi:D-alanyl-D-alanine carboxypeptidase